MNLWGRVKAAVQTLTGSMQERFFAGFSSGSGTRPRYGDQWLQAYSSVPWLRATVSKKAYEISTLDWVITRTMSAGKTVTRRDVQRGSFQFREKTIKAMHERGDAEIIYDHPLIDLLTSMNPVLPGRIGMQLAQIYYDVMGEAYFLVERGGSDAPVSSFTGRKLPRALYPIPPTWVTRTPSADKPTFEVKFGQLHLPEVPITEMLWNKNPDPANPYGRGSGEIPTLGDEFYADENAAKMISWSFYNRGRPELLVGIEGATQDEMTAFRQDWQANLGGVQGALKSHFVNQKLQVEKLGFDFQHLQVLDLRRFSRDMIRQVQGIPPEIMGIIENSNRSTIDAAEFIFGKYVIIPLAEVWREFFQNHLLAEYDPRASLDYESPLQEDKNFALSTAQSAPWSMRVKDWRELAGQEPFGTPEDDLIVVPSGVRAVRSLTQLTEAPSAGDNLMNGLSSLLGGGINVPGAGNGNGGNPPTALPSRPGTQDQTPDGMGKSAAARRLTPDEALAIARWSKVSGYSLDLEAVRKDAPIPLTQDKQTEYLRRALARLRERSTDAWVPMFGEWSERDDAMLDMMLGVKEFA
jgi:hypothetical protein